MEQLSTITQQVEVDISKHVTLLSLFAGGSSTKSQHSSCGFNKKCMSGVFTVMIDLIGYLPWIRSNGSKFLNHFVKNLMNVIECMTC